MSKDDALSFQEDFDSLEKFTKNHCCAFLMDDCFRFDSFSTVIVILDRKHCLFGSLEEVLID